MQSCCPYRQQYFRNSLKAVAHWGMADIPSSSCTPEVRGSYRCQWISLLATVVFACVACASDPPKSSSYTVKRGDTLYAIAQRFRIDHRDLARWNGVGRNNVIVPGQVLRLQAGGSRKGTAVAKAQSRSTAPPTAKPSPVLAPAVEWRWPVDGGVVTLTARPNGGHGLMIRGTAGQEVRCAAGGRVVYSGSGLLGLGELLIIKHNDSYLSAYGHTAQVQVKEGDYVAAGQRIAAMGNDSQGHPSLYFEIRINGAPGNPLEFLPARPPS